MPCVCVCVLYRFEASGGNAHDIILCICICLVRGTIWLEPSSVYTVQWRWYKTLIDCDGSYSVCVGFHFYCYYFLLLLLLANVRLLLLMCFLDIGRAHFSLRWHSRTVLRSDEIVWSGRIAGQYQVSLPRWLRRSRIFQHRGNGLFSPISQVKRLAKVNRFICSLLIHIRSVCV